MRVVIPQIAWHARDPVLTIDFDPKGKTEEGYYRLASGGADRLLLIWHLSNPTKLQPDIFCVSELNRHQRGINVVRFSPCGNYIASGDDDSYVFIWKCESVAEREEVWNVEKILRRHVEDVSDLCWSPDGNYLVSGSVDNTAVLWDVKKATPIHFWSEREHTGFVQGVVYDPLGEFSATMCIDRNLRFFNNKNGKLMSRTLKYPPAWTGEDEEKENNPDGLALALPPSPVEGSELPKSEDENSQPSSTKTESPAKKDKDVEMEVDPPTLLPVIENENTAPDNENENMLPVLEEEKPTNADIISELLGVDPNPNTEVVHHNPLSEVNRDEQQLPFKLPLKRPSAILNRIFHDDSLKTFCRRLSISPRGELLIVPGGLIPPPSQEEMKAPAEAKPSEEENETTIEDIKGSQEETKVSQEETKSEDKVPQEKLAESAEEKSMEVDDVKAEDANCAAEEEKMKEMPTDDDNLENKEEEEKEKTGRRFDPELNNAALIFCRNSWNNPCAVIPTGKSYSIAAKFNPIYYQRERKTFEYDPNFQNSEKRHDRIISCVGKLRPYESEHPVLLDMPYRLVYAVATNDSLLVGDTSSIDPLACIKNIHCTRMTDISWSPDGLVLIAASTDGFCSIMTFEEGELGGEFKLEAEQEFPALTPTAFPIAPPEPKPVKIKKPKESKEPKENDTAEPKDPAEANEKPEKEKKDKKEEVDPTTPVETKDEKKKPTNTLITMFNNIKNSPITFAKSPASVLPTDASVDAAATSSPIPETSTPTPKRTFMDGWVKKTPTSSNSENKAPRRVPFTTLSSKLGAEKSPAAERTPVADVSKSVERPVNQDGEPATKRRAIEVEENKPS